MKFDDSHLSDEQLLLELDGELSARQSKAIRAHLASCWKCRTRRQELENSIAKLVHARQDPPLPPIEAPRALLKAQLSRLANDPKPNIWAIPIAVAATVLIVFFVFHRSSQPHAHEVVLSLPDSSLTPGATLLVNRSQVCRETNTKNKVVPIALQRKVFEEYGILDAEPRAYEVDYLVTPALGGADDIHNLWPHSYSATVWNAQVKDALEDRLRDMVCDGTLDLATAQQEIAGDWIAAYRKYFHTDRPLAEHTNR